MTSRFANFKISVPDSFYLSRSRATIQDKRIYKNKYELLKILDWQISLLKDTCTLFDKGKEYQALTLANLIRLFVHDTNNSTSLLKQLDLKQVEFISAKIEPSSRSKSWASLYMISTNHEKKIAESTPRFKIRGYYDSLHPNSDYHRVNFETWWEETIEITHPLEFSRKNYILYIANKDGGVHVDESSTYLGYSHLIEKSSFVKVGDELYYSENTHFTIIRQIAFELLQTITEIIIPSLEKEYLNFDFETDAHNTMFKMLSEQFKNT